MHTSRSAAYAENHVTLGTFEVGGRVLAIDVAQMREVVRWQPVTPLPNAPALIEGVVDLRSSVIPVVDLGRERRRTGGLRHAQHGVYVAGSDVMPATNSERSLSMRASSMA